jgi:hypothetical protein
VSSQDRDLSPTFPVSRKRTVIGQHVFALQQGNIVLDTPTGPRLLATRQEPGSGVWRLEYDPEIHDNELNSLKTEEGTSRTSYDNKSIKDMVAFRKMKMFHQAQNAGPFAKVPEEVLRVIFQYAADRTFVVTDDTSLYEDE